MWPRTSPRSPIHTRRFEFEESFRCAEWSCNCRRSGQRASLGGELQRVEQIHNYIRAPEYWMQPTASQPQIDIWALGVVAMTLLSGRLLFIKDDDFSDQALLRNHPLGMFDLLGSIGESSELRRLPGWSSFANQFANPMAASCPATQEKVMDRLVAMAHNRSRTDPCWSIVTSCIRWVAVVEVKLRSTTNQ